MESDEAKRVAALVAAAAGGDEGAWSGLVDHFAGLVWSVIRGYRMSAADAADVSQTTWLRLAEHIHKVREPERIGAWLATTAGREGLRLIRHNQRAVPSDDVFLAEAPDTDPAWAPEPPLRRPAAQLGGDLCGDRHAHRRHRPDPGSLPGSAQRADGAVAGRRHLQGGGPRHRRQKVKNLTAQTFQRANCR